MDRDRKRFLYITIDSDGDGAVFTNERHARACARAAARGEPVPEDADGNYRAKFWGRVSGMERVFGVSLSVGTVAKVEVRA